MKNIPLLLAVLLGTLAMVVGISVLFTRQTAVASDVTKVMGDQRNATGSAQAKVTIVEFSDLQCPACKMAQPILTDLKKRFPENIRFVFRHYPLVSIHPNAMPAAQFAEGVGRAGKFWQIHDLLYEKQAEWSELQGAELEKKFNEYATSLGITTPDAKNWMSESATFEKVNADVSDGNALNINSTPSFFVNGRKIDAQNLSAEVEKLLKTE